MYDRYVKCNIQKKRQNVKYKKKLHIIFKNIENLYDSIFSKSQFSLSTMILKMAWIFRGPKLPNRASVSLVIALRASEQEAWGLIPTLPSDSM